MRAATGGRGDVYAGHDPESIPFCTQMEAASWLDLPASTVRAWFRGQSGFAPVLELSDASSDFLSLVNLTEVFVLAGVRRKHNLSMQSVRKAVLYLQEHFQEAHPLAALDLHTDGRHLFVRQLDQLVNASQRGQIEWSAMLDAYLRRVDRDPQKHLARLYPFTRPDEHQSERRIVIDPRLQFGRPCLASVGVPTDVILSRFTAGEPIGELAEDFGCDVSDVEEALRFEKRAAAA